jgi:hypothetical protein
VWRGNQDGTQFLELNVDFQRDRKFGTGRQGREAVAFGTAAQYPICAM